MSKLKIPQIVLSIIILFFGKTSIANENLVKVTLSELKQYAVKNNYELNSLKYDLDAKLAKMARIHSKFYPQFGVSTGIDNRMEEYKSHTNGIGYLYGNFNIFNGMRDSLNSKLSSLETENAKNHLVNSTFVIEKNVETAYYRYAFYKSIYHLKNNELSLNKTHTNLVIIRRKAGQVSEIDVMEFLLKDAKLNSDLVSIDQELLESRIELQKMLGDEIGSHIEPGPLPHQHIIEDLDNLDKRFKHLGPEILKLENQLTQNRIKSKKYQSDWLPKIDLKAQIGYLEGFDRSVRNTPQTETNLSLAILMKWEFFSGLETVHKKTESNANLISTNYRIKQKIFDIIGKLDVQVRRLKSIETKVDLEKNNVEFAEKYYQAVLAEYKRGFKNSADLNDAAEKLFMTKENKLKIIHSFLQEKITLEKIIGHDVKVKTGDHQ